MFEENKIEISRHRKVGGGCYWFYPKIILVTLNIFAEIAAASYSPFLHFYSTVIQRKSHGMVLEMMINATELEEEKQYISAIDIWIFCVLFCFVRVTYLLFVAESSSKPSARYFQILVQ